MDDDLTSLSICQLPAEDAGAPGAPVPPSRPALLRALFPLPQPEPRPAEDAHLLRRAGQEARHPRLLRKPVPGHPRDLHQAISGSANFRPVK